MTPEQFADRLSASARALMIGLRKDVATAALRAEARAKRNATTILHVRSGRLRASIRSLVEPSPDGLDLKLSAGGGREGGSTEVVYARIHELGGTIRPVKRKFLAIPLPPARTAAGVARYKTPRDVPGLALVQSLKGQYLLVKSDTGEPWYVLRKRVDIPARPYLRPALEEASAELVPRLAGTLTATLDLNVPT